MKYARALGNDPTAHGTKALAAEAGHPMAYPLGHPVDCAGACDAFGAFGTTTPPKLIGVFQSTFCLYKNARVFSKRIVASTLRDHESM
jgi:hypothetical protein